VDHAVALRAEQLDIGLRAAFFAGQAMMFRQLMSLERSAAERAGARIVPAC
jgi:short subunit dehydrogenase-like uncharacterized protein